MPLFAHLNDILPSYFFLLFSADLLKYLLVLSLFVTLILILSVLLRIRKLMLQQYTFLEIRPSYKSLKSAISTNELFTIIHATYKPTSLIEKILKIKHVISFELVSSRNAGIRYIVRIPCKDSSILKRTLLAYSPDTEVNETNDYAPITSEGVLLKELRQSHAYIYPLHTQTVLQEHDPIAYFTNHMTKLQPDELVTVQIVVTPVAPSTHFQISERIAKLKLMVADNKDISRNISGNLFSYLFDAITGVRPKKISELSKSKQLLYTTVESKINQPLFETSIRVLVSPGKGSPARMHGLLSSFETFTTSCQSIQPKRAILSSKVDV